MAIVKVGERMGIIIRDISANECWVEFFDDGNCVEVLEKEMIRLNPSEIVKWRMNNGKQQTEREPRNIKTKNPQDTFNEVSNGYRKNKKSPKI